MTYEEIASKLFNRAVLGSGKPLGDNDYENILDHEELFIYLVLMRDDGLMKYLQNKYSISYDVLDYLLSMDINDYKSMLLRPKHQMRVETANTRIRNRLIVHKRNHDKIKNLCETFDITRNSFFDVGCLLGLSMVAAISLGFKKADGCELNTRIFNRTIEILNRCRGDHQFFGEDVMTLNTLTQYNLITVIDVLEHTSDIKKTIEKIVSMLEKDGVCYFFQGNHFAPERVLTEPHYKLPLLTILPKQMTIDVLKRMNRIATDDAYVVNKWPEYDELTDILKGFDIRFEITSKEPPATNADEYRKRIYDSAKETIFKVMDEQEIAIGTEILDGYINRLKENIQGIRFKRNWEIIIKA